jgi:hypothetical protein
MPWMRAALARADKSGIGLRDQESLRNYPDFEFPELWQDLPNVAILVEPRGQVPGIPIPNSVPVTHHGGRPFCEMLPALCPLASSIEVLARSFNRTLRAEASSALQLFSTTATDGVWLWHVD